MSAKRDESDFAFQVEDMAAGKDWADLRIEHGRIVTTPPQTIPALKHGPRVVRSAVRCCIHRRPLSGSCATCEFEAPRMRGEL